MKTLYFLLVFIVSSLFVEAQDKNLDITRSMKTRNGITYNRTSLGKLIGFIAPEIIKREGELRSGGNRYNDCLCDLQFYFQEGMRPVTTRGIEQGSLYICDPIEMVVKDELKQVTI